MCDSGREPKIGPSTPGSPEVDAVLRRIAAAPAVAVPEDRTVLPAGEVIADRFVIETSAGAGGMGIVYRAQDRRSGQPVALKVMRSRTPGRERFEQEARLLAGLSHPAVVRYVAHGARSTGEPFLAMEWLDGETLAQRLRRAPLTARESLALLSRAAAGLAAAHQRAIVHRDVKPSNLFLVGGDPARAKLLDFGVARLHLDAPSRTQTGAVVGTVGYLSPEQARAHRSVDARADVFSLGCVLFECLTGQPAFSAASVVATLAKVLIEEAPRVRTLRPDLPEALEDLLARMLAKEPEGRPADAGRVLTELEGLGEWGEGVPAQVARAAVSAQERRLVTVILARPEGGDPAGLLRLASLSGGEAALLADGSLLVTIASGESAGDQAAQAASCAIALRAARPELPLAIATARAESSGTHPVGPALDRAAALIAGTGGEAVSIDEMTAGLLDGRFELRGEGVSRALVGRRQTPSGVRTLLGRPTPFVGRDKELALLEATLDECVGEPVARAVLITAPPGIGKSRLRQEFVDRTLAARTARVLMARADPMGAGSTLALLRQLVRAALGLRDGDAAVARYASIRAYLERVPGAPPAELVGELVGVPTTDAPSLLLRTARNEPQALTERLRTAFREWLSAECAVQPLLLVLEDLHWGDPASVSWLTDGLSELRERPLLVLALARPDVRERFPHFRPQEITLAGLTRGASSRLVREVLREGVTPPLVERIVARADGNAYYLEELIRHVAEGRSEEFPETVLAMAEARLQRLEPAARRVLRAASVFGETLWDGGAAALLSGDLPAAEVSDWLRDLAGREVLQSRPAGKFPGHTEYAFRHGLLREAAYAMLTESDRTAAHRIAGEWLEAAGEKDPLVVAEHFERGERPERAVVWLAKAVNDNPFAIAQSEALLALCKRGLACLSRAGPAVSPSLAGRFHLAQGFVYALRNDPVLLLEHARKAFQLLPSGSMEWSSAAAGIAFAHHMTLNPGGIAEVLPAILALPHVPAAGGVAGLIWTTVYSLMSTRRMEPALALCDLLERSSTGGADPDASFLLFLHLTRAMAAALARNDLGAALRSLRAAIDLLPVAGKNRHAFALGLSARINADAGCFELARDQARRGMAEGTKMEREFNQLWLAKAETWLGNPKAARAAFEPLDELLASSPITATAAAAQMAAIALVEGDPDEAAHFASRVTGQGSSPSAVALALSVLARIALSRKDFRRALELAEQGCAEIDAAYKAYIEGATLWLVRFQALEGLGEAEAALEALRAGRDRLLAIAATLDEAAVRTRYLETIEPNARLLALARARLGEAPAHSRSQ